MTKATPFEDNDPELTVELPWSRDFIKENRTAITSTVYNLMTDVSFSLGGRDSPGERERRARVVLEGIVRALPGSRVEAADELVLLAVRIGATWSDGRAK